MIAVLLIALDSRADQYSDAESKAAEAFYIQSGMKKEVDEIGHYVEKHYVPKFILKYGGIPLSIGKSIYEKRVTLEWGF